MSLVTAICFLYEENSRRPIAIALAAGYPIFFQTLFLWSMAIYNTLNPNEKDIMRFSIISKLNRLTTILMVPWRLSMEIA